MRFTVKSDTMFKLPNNPHLIHLATIMYGLREFIVMICRGPLCEGKVYIEEVVLTSVDYQKDVFANLKFIDEDNLAFDLAKFADSKGLLDMEKRLGQDIEMGTRLIS